MKKLFLSVFIFIQSLAGAGLFDFSNDAAQQLFLDPLELRKKELEKRVSFAGDFKKRASEVQNTIIRRLNGINSILVETDTAARKALGKEKDYFLKKISNLTERKQVLINVQEAWVRGEEILQNHIKLLSEMLEEVKDKPAPIEKKLVYNLSDERSIQIKINELNDKIASEKFKYDGLLKQRKAEEDSLLFVQKDINVKKKELKKILDKTLQPSERDKQRSLKEETELLEIASHILEELKELSAVTLERLDFETAYKKDEILLLEMRLEAFKKFYTMVDARLYIDKNDVTSALEEAEKEKNLAFESKNRWNRQRNQRKIEREHLKGQLSVLDARIKQIKSLGQEERPASQILLALHKKLETNVLALDKELELFAVRKDLEDERVSLKNAQVKIVGIRYRLQTKNFDKRELDRWWHEFIKGVKKEEADIRSLEEKRSLISNRITETRRTSDVINNKINEIKDQKDTLFRGDQAAFAESLSLLGEAKAFLERDMQFNQEYFLLCSELIRYKSDAIKHFNAMIAELETKRQFDVWKRSVRAIPLEGFTQSLLDAEDFLKDFFWRLPSHINPMLFLRTVTQFRFYDLGGLIIMLIFFLLLFFAWRSVIKFLKNRILQSCEKNIHARAYPLLRLVQVFISIIKRSYVVIFVYLFMQADIVFNFKHYLGKFGDFVWYTEVPYLVTCFYLFFIPILVLITSRLIKAFAELNVELNYVFFGQVFQEQYILLLKIALYSSIILIQFRQATLTYMKGESHLPVVIFATYTLILQLTGVFLLLIHKDNLLVLFQPEGRIFVWLKEVISKQYRPVVSFVTLLLVLSNPYIGYSNLAFLLSYAVPFTLILFKILFMMHSFVRKNSAVWFIAEEDGEVVDRFEHAKAYYGIFIILTFIALSFFTCLVIARVWGITSSLSVIGDLLQHRWTIDIGGGNRFGIIQFTMITIFIASGFLISALFDTFVLSKIFDILQLDFGLRNTASSITHYLIIFLALILGFAAVQLGSLVMWASGGALLAIGFGAKDFISDFIAGFLVLLERPLEVGSFIQISGVVGTHVNGILGTVYKISARSTTLRTVNNYFIVIPNKDLINKPIINWGYGRAAVGFEMFILIEYGANPQEVISVIAKAISQEGRILRSPSPCYRLENFGAEGMQFFTRAFISTRRVREQWDIASDIRIALLKSFADNNIRVAYPHSIIHLQRDTLSTKAESSKEPIEFKFDV